MKQNQFEFKPFDKILVRDHDGEHWRVDLFSHQYVRENTIWYSCIGNSWKQCIPYNEETKHLLGTTKDYQKLEPKEYHVWTSGAFNEWFTEAEFKSFIETAVINNKGIRDFHVLYVKHND